MYHLEEFEVILKNLQSYNQLVQACKLYTNTDFTIVALNCLALLTLKESTLPLLYMWTKKAVKFAAQSCHN